MHDELKGLQSEYVLPAVWHVYNMGFYVFSIAQPSAELKQQFSSADAVSCYPYVTNASYRGSWKRELYT